MSVWNDFFATPVGASELVNIGEFNLLHVRDEKSDGTSGGTSVSGTVHIRDLNIIKTNGIDGASISSNQITLPAGTYEVIATAPAFRCGDHKAYIYDTTAAADLVIGSNQWTVPTTSGDMSTSFVKGRFILSIESVLALRQWIAVGRTTNGLGPATRNSGQVEVYSDVYIRKITPVNAKAPLQVIYGQTTTPVANSTNTYASTTLSASITPSFATSTILIQVIIGLDDVSFTETVQGRLVRDATPVHETFEGTVFGFIPINFLDLPATTSSITYNVEFRRGLLGALSAAVTAQLSGALSTIVLTEIKA